MSDHVVYAVFARTDDYYDDGNLVSLHATLEGSIGSAGLLLGSDVNCVGRIDETWVEAWTVAATFDHEQSQPERIATYDLHTINMHQRYLRTTKGRR